MDKATLNVAASAQNMVAERLATTLVMADITSVLWEIGGNENGDVMSVSVPQNRFPRNKKSWKVKRPGHEVSEPVCDERNPSTN